MCSPIRPGGLKGREAGEGMDLKARLWVGGAAAGEGGEREKRTVSTAIIQKTGRREKMPFYRTQ